MSETDNIDGMMITIGHLSNNNPPDYIINMFVHREHQ